MAASWRIVFARAAEKALDDLPARDRDRVLAAIDRLADDPLTAAGVKRLSGRDDYRLRVGDHRVIYDLDHGVLTVRVVRIAHRREAYR